VRLRLLAARRLGDTSAPSFTEKMDWFEKLGETSAPRAVPGVSPEAKLVPVAFVRLVDVDDRVSFRSGGEEDRLRGRRVDESGLSGLCVPALVSSA
jgi:hypothetical protein